MKTNLFNRKERKAHKGGIPHSAFRTPHWFALTFALFALFAVPSAPAQTNNLRPGACAVMVTTNGVLVAPTNFFATNAALLNVAVTNLNATNLIGVVAPLHGGLGYANTNLIPSGAVYDNGVAYGFPAYVLNVVSNQSYYFNYTNIIANEDVFYGVGWESLSPPVVGFPGGSFVAGTNRILLYTDGSSGDPVTSQIWPEATNLYGTFIGGFYGTLSNNSVVPDSALSGNVQLRSAALNETANGGVEHKLWSTNTTGGSTLSLVHYGPLGYADINFFTAANQTAAVGSPDLQFAIGCSPNANSNNAAYASPYIELYSGKSFWWVTSGTWFGGVRGGGKFNFVWFQNGTTNTPMFEIDRASNTITNYSPVVCAANLTFSTAGKGLQLKGAALGAAAKIGESTLVAGSVIVTNSAVTSSSLIFLNHHTAGGTLGSLSYIVSAGTSFTVTSTSATDTSTVIWHIIEKN